MPNTTYTWATGTSRLWTATGAWTKSGSATSSFPNDPTATAIIATPATYSVDVSSGSSFTVDEVDLNTAGATLALSGTLDFSAGANHRLVLNAGTLALNQNGTIKGATIAQNGGLLQFNGGNGGILDGVTVLGPLNITGFGVLVKNGLTVETASGGQPGTINVAGFGSELAFAPNQTLDNVTINLNAPFGFLFTTYGGPGALTLTSGSVINQTVGPGRISGGLINQGHINATAGTISFFDNFPFDGLVNQATLSVSNSAEIDIVGGYVGSTFVNSGLVQDSGTLRSIDITGNGSIAINAASLFEAQGSMAAGQTISFNGSGAKFTLDAPAGMAGSATNFDVGDTIDLKTIDPATVSYFGGRLHFTPQGGTDTSFALALGPSVTSIQAVSDGSGGSNINALCFCPGTALATPHGEVPVEHLKCGDRVLTLSGETRPIVWIGSGRVLATRLRRNAATPVIVRRGALADNVPCRDLRVTKGHSFLLDDVLIPVEFLVNHRSILWDDQAQEVTVYHVELATHDVLVANGAPAESYRDDGNRWLFHNANTGWDLPAKTPCAPVLTGGPIVDRVWRRLLDRAGQRPGFQLTDDPDLHLLVDGQRLDPTGRQGDVYRFLLPRSPRSIGIRSRDAVPTELGIARDARSLGVALRRIEFVGPGTATTIASADKRLVQGFHDHELADDIRWTNGDAWLPTELLPGPNQPCALILHLGGETRYLDDGDTAKQRIARGSRRAA